jgi:hypothetical protein
MIQLLNRVGMVKTRAEWISADDIKVNEQIGNFGVQLIQEIAAKKNGVVNILNAL